MRSFSPEETAAGEKLFRDEIYSLYTVIGQVVFLFKRDEYKWKTKEESRNTLFSGFKRSGEAIRRDRLELEFITNVARYYDIRLKRAKGAVALGEEYLADKLAANIDMIKRLCNKSTLNEIVDPCNFTYENITVKDGALLDPEYAVPVIRAKILPAILSGKGSGDKALTRYEYAIALGLASGLPYEWVYCLAHDYELTMWFA